MNKFTTKQLEVNIEDIFPNKWNPNVQDNKIFEKEKNSIKKYGFIQPILVRDIKQTPDSIIYEIIDGEHRWKACKELGFTKIKIESIGIITDEIAKLLTINLNNLRGKDDILKRAAILRSLNQGQLAFLPWDQKEIEQEIKLLDFDFKQFDDAKINETQKDSYTQSLEIAIKLEKHLRSLHQSSSDTKLRLLCEGFFDWIKTFSQIK